MKRALVLCAALGAAGCSSVHSAAKMAEDNKALVMKFSERINKGDLSVIDEIFDSGFIEHSPEPGVPPTKEGLKRAFTMYLKAFPDMKMSTLHLIAEGDFVVIHGSTTGTNRGEMLGMPATNKAVNFNEMHLVRISNGKVMEHWGVEDSMTMMQQLGLAPAPGNK